MAQRYPQPDNEDAFEQMCLRFYRKLWKNESLELYAKRGEKQHGVDIYDPLSQKPVRAVQCKHHELTKALPPSKIKEEVRKAEESPLPIEHYVIATTARKTKEAQHAIVELNSRSPGQIRFTVELHFWEDICERLGEFAAVRAQFIVHGQDAGADLVASLLQDPRIASVAAAALSAMEVAAGAFAEIEELLAKRNVDAARHELDKLSRPDDMSMLSSDNQYQLLRLRGKLALELGEFESASKCLLAAFDVCPELDQAKHNQVLGYSLICDSSKAFELANQYLTAGIVNPSMVCRLIENATSLEQISEHKSRIAPFLESDECVNTALCHKLTELGDVVSAADAAKRAVAIAPDSPHAQFTAAMPHHNAALNGTWRKRKSELQQAIAHYDSALKKARLEKYPALIPEILINRARAHMLIGDNTAAAADYREAVAAANTPAIYAEGAVSALLHEQDFAGAWEFLGSLDKSTREGRFLAAATKFYNTEDKNERLQYLKQMKQLSEEDWPRALECRFHFVHWALLLNEPLLGRACITAAFQNAHPFHSHTALAWIELEAGNGEMALKHANAAVEHGVPGSHTQEVRLLADVFQRSNHYAMAIDLLERIAVPGLLNGDMKNLIVCAQRLDRHDLLLRMCRELRDSGEQDDQLRQVEIQLLNRYAPEQGLALADEFITASPSPAYFVAFKNVLAIRLNRPEDVHFDPSHLPGAGELPPGEARLVTLPYVHCGLYDEALRFLHAQLRAYVDDEVAHANYVAFFSKYGHYTSLRVPPDNVQIACAVLIDVDGKTRWVIVENEAPLPSRNEFCDSSDLAKCIIGHKVGDEIELPTQFVRTETAAIREIQTKYVRSFQDSLQHFRDRFPGTSFIQQMSLGDGDEFDPSPLIESLKHRREYVERCIEFYKRELCPLYFFAKRVGISELDAVASLGSHGTGLVKCCQATPQEFEKAVADSAGSKVVVLDLSGIITLALVDGWEHLDPDTQYLVSQATKEIVDEWVNEATQEATDRSGHASVTESGDLVIHETTPDERAARRADLETIQTMVNKHCECRASEAVAAIEPEKRKLYEDIVGFHHVEAMSLARDMRAILWSDDVVISLIAAADFDVKSVWTQLAFKRLVDAGRVSKIDFNRISCILAGGRYVHTLWNAETVIKAGELTNWDLQQRPFKQCIALIATTAIPIRKKAKLALETMKCLRRSNCIELSQSAVIQEILSAVGNRKAVAWMNAHLEMTFGVDVASVAFLRPEIHYWLNSHIG